MVVWSSCTCTVRRNLAITVSLCTGAWLLLCLRAPIHMYTVEHHKPAEAPPEKRGWDASRSDPPPQPSKEKLRRVLKEEAKRAAHSLARLPAYMKTTWDAPRPAGSDLPHFDYAWSAADKPAHIRDESQMTAHIDHARNFRVEKAERQERCSHTAWNSSLAGGYKSLGSVPLVPAAVRPSRPVPTPLTILGDAWVPAEVQTQEPPLALTPGVAVEGMVPKGGYRIYSVESLELRRITLRLHTYSGDTELFVSKTYARPDASNFTWRSLTSHAFEELIIQPDDPRGGGGTYYVSVYGGRESDFEITAEVIKPPISLPPRLSSFGTREQGYSYLSRELRSAAERVTYAAAGGSVVGRTTDTLEDRGAHASSVIAASRQAARALRHHSKKALRNPGSYTPRALSRSLASLEATMPPRTAAEGGSDDARGRGALQPAHAQSEPSLFGLGRGTRTDPSKDADADRRALIASGSEPSLVSTRRVTRSAAGHAAGGGNDSAAGVEESFAASCASSRRTRGESIPQLTWQPPDGYDWSDLPKEARLVQAITESAAVKAELTSRMASQLVAYDRLRPYKALTQTFSLASIEPTSSACSASTVRQGAQSMLRGYTRTLNPGVDGDAPAAAPSESSYHVAGRSASAGRSAGRRVPFTEHPSVQSIDAAYKPPPAVRALPGYARPARDHSRRNLHKSQK